MGGPGKGKLKRTVLQKSSSSCDRHTIHKGHTYVPLQEDEDFQDKEHEIVDFISDGSGKGILKRSRLQNSSSKCARQPIQKKRTYFSLQDEVDRQEQEHETVEYSCGGPGKGILKISKLQKSSSKCDRQPIQKRHTHFSLQDEEDHQEEEHEIVESFSGGPGKGILKRSGLQKSSSNCGGQPIQKRRNYFRVQDDEYHQEPEHETVQTLSPHLSRLRRVLDSSVTIRNQYDKEQQENEHIGVTNISEPLHGENIGSNSHGKSVTRKETRALTQNRTRQLKKGKLAFEVDDCAGRIVGDDSQVFITKGGCVMRQFVKFDGTTWRKQSPTLKTDIISKCTKISTRNKKNKSCNEIPPTVGTVSIARVVDKKRRQGQEVTAIDQYKIAHYSERKNKMVNEKADEIWNELQYEEATSSCTPAEICLKKLHRIPGHIRGRSASTKQNLATENLRMELQVEKERSNALEGKILVMKELQEKQEEKMVFMMKQISRLSRLQSQTTGLEEGVEDWSEWI